MEHGKKRKIRMITDLIRANLSFLFFSVFLFYACVSYDKPLIYHKNFQPGTHPLLRFDGYYTTTSTYLLNGKIRLVFFYRDGSVWFAEQDIPAANVDVIYSSATVHSWGNFQIKADTILLERFVQEANTGNFNRVILKGIVKTESIQWVQRTYHKSNPDSVNYDMIFQPHGRKPDSTQNWTRTRRQYNE